MYTVNLLSIWTPSFLTIFILGITFYNMDSDSSGYGIDLTPLFWLFGGVVGILVTWLIWALVK